MENLPDAGRVANKHLVSKISDAVKILEGFTTVEDLQRASKVVQSAGIQPTDIDLAIEELKSGNMEKAQKYIFGPSGRGSGLGAIRDLKNIALLKKSSRKHNPLDGMSKRKVSRLVNSILRKAPIKGVHRDPYWRPIKAIFRVLEDAGIPFNINEAKYQSGPSGDRRIPVRKVWQIQVDFQNDRGRPTSVYIHMIASGTGPPEDPLESYDVTAYAS